MSKRTSPLLPATERRLRDFGERIRLARMRRKLTAGHLAERAGMSPMTLRGIERGGPGATMGAYAAVLQVLGLDGDIDLLAAQDTLGRELQDSRLRVAPATRAPARAEAAHKVTEPPPEPYAPPPRGGVLSEDLARLVAPKPSRRKKGS